MIHPTLSQTVTDVGSSRKSETRPSENKLKNPERVSLRTLFKNAVTFMTYDIRSQHRKGYAAVTSGNCSPFFL